MAPSAIARLIARALNGIDCCAMNSVSHPWIVNSRRAACALVALLVVAPGCGDDGGGTDTDGGTGTTPGTGTGTMTTPTTSDGTTDGTDTTGSTGNMGMLSHAADIQPIWDANCVTGCHVAGGTASAWFLLTSDVAYTSIVNKASISFPTLTLVVPGDPDMSYLMHKIQGTQADVGGGTASMPQPPAMPLADADVQKISAWIEQGAMP